MGRFRAWVSSARGLGLPDYRALWRWSVSDLEGFWEAIAEFFDVALPPAPERVPAEEVVPGTEWFPGAALNYPEHALRDG